jgi:hypothetical protein
LIAYALFEVLGVPQETSSSAPDAMLLLEVNNVNRIVFHERGYLYLSTYRLVICAPKGLESIALGNRL